MPNRTLIPLVLGLLFACGGDDSGSTDTATTTTETDTTIATDGTTTNDDATTAPPDSIVAPDTTDTTDTTDPVDTADTTIADVVPDADVPLPLMCAGRCGAEHDPEVSCHCDEACIERGDCCVDYCESCLGAEPGCETSGPCEETCVDLGNQSVACDGGLCTRACLPGFEDCNSNPGDGCEAELARDADHCGACEAPCDAGAFGAPACQGGQCVLACNPGRGACNDVTFDGCETDLTASEDDCGYCGVSCPTLPNTTPVCAASSCTTECLDGFASCDDKANNGCEANLQDDEATCGACNVVCGPAESCEDGGCACSGTFAYLYPPTEHFASAMAPDTFAFALSCNLAESSLDDPTIRVTGVASGTVAGSLTREGDNGLRWTSDGGPLYGGDEVDITIGAGFRSFDSLKTSGYRVLKARVATSSAGSGFFSAGQTIGLAGITSQVVAGDFDGDGDVDLATNSSGVGVGDAGSVHLNDGLELGASVRNLGQIAIQDIVAHDFDQDGRTDLLVLNNSSGSFGPTRVLWGAATDPLSTSTNVGTIGSNLSPAVGDVDGDGDIDIVIGQRIGASNANGAIFKNNGDGTFANVGALLATNPDAEFGVLFDVDHDGDLDLFQTHTNVADRVFINNGSGTFTAGTTYGTTTSEPTGVDVGDINGDGYADVLVVNRTVADKIYLGAADGTLTEVAAPSLTGTVLEASTTKLADIDGDGDLDIIGVASGKLAIHYNDGAGNFAGGGTSFDAITFVVADLDGDGDVDIASLASQSGGVRILRNACSGESCTCGNSALNGAEQCDDGPDGSAFCDPDCTLRRCGDGYVNALADEQCDDGNDVDDDACRDDCVSTTCSDGIENGDETDVDCGGACATKCAAREACEVHADCQSGICAGFVCAYHQDFEDGVIPAELSTGPTNPWLVDQQDPIGDSAHSLISHDFTVGGTSSSTAGNSSIFLTATFGEGGGMLLFDVQTNCVYASVLSLRIDGAEVVQLYGRRLQLDDGYVDSYEVPAGTHTFEWRYESKIGSGAGLIYPPYHRAWIDNIVLINGAP